MIQSPAGYQGDVRIKRYLDFYQAGYGVAMLSSGTTAFTPASLFAASEPGGWYDPSDLTTLYQDAAGTTPVTAVEQPVGLVLDKSRGLVLGSELVTNGDFSNGTTGWSNIGSGSGTFTVSGGKATCTTIDGSNFVRVAQSVTTVAGRTYRVTFTVTRVSGVSNYYIVMPGYGADLAAGTRTVHFVASGTSSQFTIQTSGNNAGVFELDDVSIKELPGAHLSQSTAAARPVLSSRVNLLTYTEQFDNAAWTKQNVTVASNSVVAPDGATTADTLTDNSTSGRHAAVQAVTVASGVSYAVTCRFKAGTGSFAFLCLSDAGAAAYTAVLNMADGTISQTRSASVTGVSSSVAVLSGGWYLVTITCNAPAATSYVYAGMAGAATGNTFDGAGVPTYSGSGSTIYIWGADLRPANAGVGLPAYQRVGAATDYDTTGFPYYLRTDGTDDGMSTAAIDFTSTDKMAVFAGVRKLRDTTAIVGVIAELSQNIDVNNGCFALLAPRFSAIANSSQWLSKGTVVASVNYDSFTTPSTRVFACSGDISGDAAIFRQNGTVAGTSSADQGTGNFGNYPLFVGARNNADLRFNGHIYGLVVVGRALTAAEISSMESWMAAKTGVTL